MNPSTLHFLIRNVFGQVDEVPDLLQKYIPELNKETGQGRNFNSHDLEIQLAPVAETPDFSSSGTHVVFKQQGERDRAESSCISLLALVA